MGAVLAQAKNKDNVDAAIRVPDRITTDDGRILRLTSWKPVVQVGDVVRVTAELVVHLEDQ